jgi:hypothetical protein
MVRLGAVAVAGNTTRTVDFILDRHPKKVALNFYKDILERLKFLRRIANIRGSGTFDSERSPHPTTAKALGRE